MKTLKRFAVFILSFAAAAFLLARGAQTIPSLKDAALPIFAKNCTTAGCHSGREPSMSLSLEASALPDGLIGKASLTMPGRLIIDPAAPERSYLLAKLRGDPGISGERMPLDLPPLSSEDIKVIQEWVLSLGGSKQGGGAAGASARTGHEPFLGLSLVNLPTTEIPPPRRFYFRVSHRFYPSLSAGWDSLFGLDGPAEIWLGLGYALTGTLSLSLGRTTQGNEMEGTVRWRFIDQDVFPFEAAVQGGLGWATEEMTGRKTADSRNFKVNLQLSLAKRITERLSVLLVPSWSTHTDHWEADPQNTVALGIGGRYLLFNNLALIGEWVPVLAGYAAGSNGWGFGLEKKIGGHVFHFFVVNSIGLTPDLYLPGGDLKLADGDLRFGFNIFRTF